MGRAAALLALLPQQQAREFVINSMFHEVPDRNAALAAMALWAAVSCALVVLTCRTRAWFMLLAAAAAFMQLAGYALRASLLDQPRPQLNHFTAMVALFLVSPSLLAATNYLCLGKLLTASSAARPAKLRSSDHDSSSTAAQQGFGVVLPGAVGALLGVSRVGSGQGWRMSVAAAVSAAFCAGELCALVMQCVGAALVASSAGSSRYNADSRRRRDTGRWLLLAGVCMQLAVSTVFTGLALTVKLSRKFGYAGTGKCRVVFVALFASIVCQYVRTIFRVVVYAYGLTSFLATRERFYVYGFDFAPLWACGALFCCLHYGLFLGSGVPYVQGLKLQQQQQQQQHSGNSAAASRTAQEQEGPEDAGL